MQSLHLMQDWKLDFFHWKKDLCTNPLLTKMEWGQFDMMKVGIIVPYIYSIIPVIRILTFIIFFSE